MASTLVIRLSSLGDVAILIPVLYSVANRYPGDEFLLITKKPLQPLFINKPSNVTVFPVHTKEKHKGIQGMWRLVHELPVPAKVADLHNVIRSRMLDACFKYQGAEIAVINKGRKEKRALIRQNNKRLIPLTSSCERYQQVFEDLGYDASLDFVSLFPHKNKKEETGIGIAPFAKHPGKIYPLDKMEQVVQHLSRQPNTQLYLFGSKDEKKQLEQWAEKYEHVRSVAGTLSFHDELLLMNDLDLMITMDSANMHLASLVNTPVVSIWGATHPDAGFYGFRQNPAWAIQTDLACRPCSIFGDKPCFRGDFACMEMISPEKIVNQIKDNLK
jgi:ADP-heptose:LPS heptosyltransferase